jgi:hypothetical protein
MVSVYRPCPVCGEEIEFEILPDSDDTGAELCYPDGHVKVCDCALTDDQWYALEDQACLIADFSPREVC